eukprot:CAMPEP_0184359328 /NCGR_PEP_ID=MMETSP1089-20130417/119544_1 /TAXON_ID=38269 ORGANISM="Gloeochaete wittrockiana, Strain SAG46.84" /NCGR_SAMPLE_ID=MMETSP1089 /ASSEMBLY_ACC=CAM_ASM_000445 /LENGTH=141 /DNA_ID=CAMNT_0026698081 /DNA_START=564 /DNA_END=985 /DNA_ORIENTATION=-
MGSWAGNPTYFLNNIVSGSGGAGGLVQSQHPTQHNHIVEQRDLKGEEGGSSKPNSREESLVDVILSYVLSICFMREETMMPTGEGGEGTGHVSISSMFLVYRAVYAFVSSSLPFPFPERDGMGGTDIKQQQGIKHQQGWMG